MLFNDILLFNSWFYKENNWEAIHFTNLSKSICLSFISFYCDTNWFYYWSGLINTYFKSILCWIGINLYNCLGRVKGIYDRGEQGGEIELMFIFKQFLSNWSYYHIENRYGLPLIFYIIFFAFIYLLFNYKEGKFKKYFLNS